MKVSRCTDAQIITILREAETGTTTIDALCRKHAIAEATFYRGRNKYGGVDATAAARLKELERENARLKKLLAERVRSSRWLVPPSSIAARCQCGTRNSLRICASVPSSILAMAIAAYGRCCGTRGRGSMPNGCTACGALRAWASPKRRPRRRVRHHQVRPLPAARPNHVWAYDFVHDTCANGQHLKILTVVDEWSREGLAVEVAGRITPAAVIRVVQRLIAQYGTPAYLRSDNGPEFVARAVKTWLAEQGIQTAYIEGGKPWQNGTNESFNGKLRDECLNLEWVRHRREAQIVIEQWRRQYNEQRPHSSLGYQPPSQVCAMYHTSPILSP